MTAIVSGGQTGADRGALDAAIELGLGHGGWAPKVGGPRESKEPGIQAAVRDALVWVFEDDFPTVRQEVERPTGAAAQPAVDPGSTPSGSDQL